MPRPSLKTLVLLASLTPVAAQPQDLIIGTGYTDYPDAGIDSGILALDYRHTPFLERGRLSTALGGTLSLTGQSDAFIGFGLSSQFDLTDRWFIESSFMPGFHHEGTPGNDLGTAFEFRSLLGVGYRFENGLAASVALTHKSNASLDDKNPGADALLLRLHRPFSAR
jgi:hypothetical protein